LIYSWKWIWVLGTGLIEARVGLGNRLTDVFRFGFSVFI
jgi:hypothetical protein